MAGQKANKSVQRINSIKVQSSAYGLAIANGWGTFRCSPNIMWMGPLKSLARKESSGKGGSKSTSYDYFASSILGVCAGPIDGIYEAFKDQAQYVDGTLYSRYASIATALNSAGSAELAADYQALSTAYAAINTGSKTALQYCGLSLAIGTLGQTPQPFLSGDDAIGYSLLAYVYAQDYALSSQATMPSHTFTVTTTTRATVAGVTLDDAHAADILIDFLSNSYRSVPGWDYSWIGDLTEYRTACTAYGLFLSYGMQNQTQASTCIETLMECTNSVCYWSEGVLKVKPLADTAKTANGVTFTPDLTPVYSLTNNDYIAENDEDPVRVKIKDAQEAYNIVQLQYEDRTHQYNTVSVSATDPAGIETNGPRREPPVTLDAIKMPSVAQALASLRVQRLSNIWETYTFRLDSSFALLEPSDLLQITDVRLGLSAKLVRILSITEVSGGDAYDIEAEEMLVGASAPPLMSHPIPLTVVTDYNAAPGNTTAPILINPPRSVTTGDGMEAWLAATGGSMWGGCEVWLSFDGTNYSKYGEIDGPARYGTLTQALPVGTDPDTLNPLKVLLSDPDATLLNATEAAANAGATMCLVGDELISYATASLTGVATYTLSYLRRAQNGTSQSLHAVGAPFVRLDDSLFKYAYDKSKIGATVHVKLPAFNIYKLALQDLASVTAYTVTLDPGRPTFSAVYADGTPIDDLRPAEAGADVTSNHTSQDTANVATRPATQVINDLDNSALSNLRNQLAQQGLQGWMQGVAYDPTGKNIQLVSIDAKQTAEDAITTLNLMGAMTSDSSAFVFNTNAVKVGSQTMAQYMSGVQTQLGNNTASITNLQTSMNGQEARVTIATNVNGKVVGLDFGTSGTSSFFDLVTSSFRLIDPSNPANVTTPFVYASGSFTLTGNVTINGNLLISGTLTNEKLATNATMIIAPAAWSGTLGGNGSFSTIITTSIVMPRAGYVYISGISNQSFTGDYNWAYEFIINGVTVPAPSGTQPGDSVAIGGNVYVSAAGTVPVQIRWKGDSGATLKAISMMVFGVPGTS